MKIWMTSERWAKISGLFYRNVIWWGICARKQEKQGILPTLRGSHCSMYLVIWAKKEQTSYIRLWVLLWIISIRLRRNSWIKYRQSQSAVLNSGINTRKLLRNVDATVISAEWKIAIHRLFCMQSNREMKKAGKSHFLQAEQSQRKKKAKYAKNLISIKKYRI